MRDSVPPIREERVPSKGHGVPLDRGRISIAVPGAVKRIGTTSTFSATESTTSRMARVTNNSALSGAIPLDRRRRQLPGRHRSRSATFRAYDVQGWPPAMTYGLISTALFAAIVTVALALAANDQPQLFAPIMPSVAGSEIGSTPHLIGRPSITRLEGLTQP